MKASGFPQRVHHFVRVGDPTGVLVQVPDAPVRQAGVEDEQGYEAGEGEGHSPVERAIESHGRCPSGAGAIVEPPSLSRKATSLAWGIDRSEIR